MTCGPNTPPEPSDLFFKKLLNDFPHGCDHCIELSAQSVHFDSEGTWPDRRIAQSEHKEEKLFLQQL